jgi:hypothetical protein
MGKVNMKTLRSVLDWILLTTAIVLGFVFLLFMGVCLLVAGIGILVFDKVRDPYNLRKKSHEISTMPPVKRSSRDIVARRN